MEVLENNFITSSNIYIDLHLVFSPVLYVRGTAVNKQEKPCSQSS